MFGWILNRRRLLADSAMLGRWGQDRCEKFLRTLGYRTLARNFFCKSGEIDLIMTATDGTVVFVEVKTRSGEEFSIAEESITPSKQKKLARAARYFMASGQIRNRPLRFDVVTVILGRMGRPEIRHYKRAFVPQ